MTPNKLKQLMRRYELSNTTLGEISMRDARTVRRWLSGESDIPETVADGLVERVHSHVIIEVLKRWRDDTVGRECVSIALDCVAHVDPITGEESTLGEFLDALLV